MTLTASKPQTNDLTYLKPMIKSTMTQNRFVFSLRFAPFLLALMVCMSFSQPTNVPTGGAYMYKIKVHGVTDDVAFKDLCAEIDPIFDSHARFESGHHVVIFSDVDVSEARLEMKLSALGYTLISYIRLDRNQTGPK